MNAIKVQQRRAIYRSIKEDNIFFTCQYVFRMNKYLKTRIKYGHSRSLISSLCFTFCLVFFMNSSVSAQTPKTSSILVQDKFESEKSLEQWKSLEISGWASKWRTAKISNGNFVIQPKSSGWFEDNYGGFLYHEVTGDFIVSTRIKVEGNGVPTPETSFSLAGLFIRKPRDFSAESWRPGQENWLFFSTGCATESGKPQFEIKSTYQSTSTLKIFPSKQGWMDLRIVRLGEIFSLLYRYDGAEWTLLDQFIRPDFPMTLQVGITAYADWNSVAAVYPDYASYNKNGAPKDQADLTATFDSFSIRRPNVKKDLPIAQPISAAFWADFTN